MTSWFSRIHPYLILTLICGGVFFFNLGNSALFEEDEPKNAECGREMFVKGEWIVPTFNEELRTDKPIFLYWLMLSSFHLFGMNEFAARLPSAMLSTGSVLLVFLLGRRLFNAKSGFLASVALATSLMFVVIARASTPDGTLIFFITLTMTIYAWNIPLLKKQTENSQALSEISWPGDFVPSSIWTFVALGITMGIAVLAKGPVGVVLPCVMFGGTLLMARLIWFVPVPEKSDWVDSVTHVLLSLVNPRAFLTALLALRPLTMVGTALVVALPWYVAVTYQTDGAWLTGFLGKHNVGRFLTPMEQHSGPIIYYIPVICMGFFPWSLFLMMTIYTAVVECRKSKPTAYQNGVIAEKTISVENFGHLYFLCWLGIYFSFFSFAQTKLPNYILPCYPALALLTGSYLSKWMSRETILSARWMLTAIGMLATVGVILAIGVPIASSIYFPGFRWFGFIGILFLVQSGIMLRAIMQQRQTWLVQSYCGFAVVNAIIMMGFLAAPLSYMQDGYRIGKEIVQHFPADTPIATFRYFSPNLPFYAQRQILRFSNPEQLVTYSKAHPEAVIIVADKAYTEIKDLLPSEVSVLGSYQRFLRRHELIVLGQKPTPEFSIGSVPTNLH
jgi:4-amino-4-deoxy-L-arabinose transferase-like glycosyltransferase